MIIIMIIMIIIIMIIIIIIIIIISVSLVSLLFTHVHMCVWAYMHACNDGFVRVCMYVCTPKHKPNLLLLLLLLVR